MLDIIGTIYTPGTYDAEGNVITKPTPTPGWHVNSPQPIEGWDAYKVEPATPLRVFAGHTTHFYSFADEAAFTAAAIEAGLIQPEPEPEPEMAGLIQPEPEVAE